jgi:hypothetical protein
MTESRTERLAPWAGVLAAALMAGGFVLVGVDAPGSDASRAEVLSTYGDDAVSSRQAAGVLVVALGAVALLGFAAHLRGVLASRVADTNPLPAAAFAGGIVLAGSLVGGTVMSAAVSAGSYFDSYRPDADLAMALVAGGFYLSGFAAIAGGLLIAATSIVFWRAELLPRWLTGAGVAIAVASIPAGLLGMWILVETVWIAIAAGLLARRRAVGAPAPILGGAA